MKLVYCRSCIPSGLKKICTRSLARNNFLSVTTMIINNKYDKGMNKPEVNNRI